MSYDNPWLYNGQVVDSEVLENYLGFVYLITNLTNNKKYIGKKLLKRTKTKIVKGRKKRSLVESDWKDYYGSNKELAEEVNKIGAYNFKREITRFCTKKGELSYYEAQAQFAVDILLRDDYYNNWISVKVQRSHLPK
jgi:hypothetical protein